MSDSTRETLHELGDRARGIVEELARKAGERRASAPPASSAGPEEQVPGLDRRLGELRACVGEVADVLEATVERLETVELQLGDPDERLERQLCEGVERCERVLMGIEHRVARVPFPDASASAVRAADRYDEPVVLVVAPSSSRRAALCLALERQGLSALAAADLAQALAVTARRGPDVALIALDGSAQERGDFLDEWKEYEEHGNLPGAVVLEPAGAEGPAVPGFDRLHEDHGEAALAASLARAARRGDETADSM